MINTLAIATRGRLSASTKKALTLATLGLLLGVAPDVIHRAERLVGGGGSGTSIINEDFIKKKEKVIFKNDDEEVLLLIKIFLDLT